MKIKNSMMYKFIFCLKGGLFFSLFLFFFGSFFFFFPVKETIELLCKDMQDL